MLRRIFPTIKAIMEPAGLRAQAGREGPGGRGILSWVQRVKRVRERCSDLLGDNGWR
jgi:hypothetical protein